MPEDVLAILEVVGVRPVMVEGLGRDALLLPHERMLLVDSALTAQRAVEISDWALAVSAARLAPTAER